MNKRTILLQNQIQYMSEQEQREKYLPEKPSVEFGPNDTYMNVQFPYIHNATLEDVNTQLRYIHMSLHARDSQTPADLPIEELREKYGEMVGFKEGDPLQSAFIFHIKEECLQDNKDEEERLRFALSRKDHKLLTSITGYLFRYGTSNIDHLSPRQTQFIEYTLGVLRDILEDDPQ